MSSLLTGERSDPTVTGSLTRLSLQSSSVYFVSISYFNFNLFTLLTHYQMIKHQNIQNIKTSDVLIQNIKR